MLGSTVPAQRPHDSGRGCLVGGGEDVSVVKRRDTTGRRGRGGRRRLGSEARAAAAGQQVFSKLARSSVATRESDGQRSSSSPLCANRLGSGGGMIWR